MATYDDDDMDEVFENEDQQLAEEQNEAGTGSNRNFFLALGILGGLFLVVTVVLVLLWLNNRQPASSETANIDATNAAILTANAQTAIAATELSAFRLTPSVTPTSTVTPVPPTATATPLLAQASETPTDAEGAGGAAGDVTPTSEAETLSVSEALAESGKQTQTSQAALTLTGTPATLPQSGFADEVGLPGLFGMALGLILVIIIVRRLRLAANH